MSKPIQKVSPSCPLHTVPFYIWVLWSLSSSYVYSFCRKELFPVEKSLCERQKSSSVSFSSQLFIREFRKGLGKVENQCKWSRLWKASPEPPLPLPKGRQQPPDKLDLPPSLGVGRTLYLAHMVGGSLVLLLTSAVRASSLLSAPRKARSTQKLALCSGWVILVSEKEIVVFLNYSCPVWHSGSCGRGFAMCCAASLPSLT